MREGARGAILARAHVEVLALGSFEVLVAALRASAIAIILLIAVRPLHVSTLVAASAALVRASALVGASASTTTTLVVVTWLVAAAAGGVLVMVVVVSTATSDISMVALLLQTLVVLLHDGGLGVGIGRDWIRDLSQLVFSVREEAGVRLRADTLLHEVTAELSLELLGVELGPGAHRAVVASTIVVLVAAVSTSAVVVTLLSTIGSLGVGTRAAVSVLRATHSLELIGHLRLIGLRHHHGRCAIHRHEGVSAVEPSGAGSGELSRIVLLLRHSHAHVLLVPHHLLLKHRNVGGVIHVNARHRLRLNWLLQLLSASLCLLLVFLIVFVLYRLAT